MNLLRAIILVEVLTIAAAIGTGFGIESWRAVPIEEIQSSPDASFSIEGLLLQYGFFSGVYFGIAIPLIFLALAQCKEIAMGSFLVKAQWITAVLLPIVVLSAAVAFGIRPW